MTKKKKSLGLVAFLEYDWAVNYYRKSDNFFYI